MKRAIAVASSNEATTWSGVGEIAERYLALLKLRPMSAVIFAAIAGLVAAPGHVEPLTAIIAIICIALGGGGSAALNMWYEADLDARMRRTAGRPIPSGKVRAAAALVLGSCLCVGAVATMGFVVGWFAAVVLFATISAYFGLYTVALKHRTPMSVVIGGALAGFLTPLSGWAAATGEIGFPGLALFLYIFFWTPPHVWSQALYRAQDYAAAGVPMLPVAAGSRVTQRWIFIFTLVHVLLAIAPSVFGLAGTLYGLVATTFGVLLLFKAYRLALCVDRGSIHKSAHEFFRLSIRYVLALLSALMIDRLWIAPL